MFNCGRAVGLVRDAVGMPGRASPQVGVGRCGDDAVGIRPVVVQSFPDAARTSGNVGHRGRTKQEATERDAIWRLDASVRTCRCPVA
jgi:hypothetical protein